MPRIRSIKPEFFLNDDLAALPPLTRLLFIGLWTEADREGRMEYRPKRLKVALLPYDECDIEVMVEALAKAGFVTRYEVSDDSFLQVNKFAKHQSPHYKELPSVLPPPDVDSTLNQRRVDVDSTLPSGREGKGREGSGEERPPKLANFPPCFLQEVEREGVTLSFRGHLLRDLEQYAGQWPSLPKNIGKLGAAIAEGCPPDCDGSPVRKCATALIRHARKVHQEKGDPFATQLFLYQCREGAR